MVITRATDHRDNLVLSVTMSKKWLAAYRTLQLTSTFRMRLRRNGDSVLAAELRR